MDMKHLPSHSRSLYIDAYQQFKSAIYQFVLAYQLLLTAYQQKDPSFSDAFVEKATLTSHKLYHIYTVRKALWSSNKSTLYPQSPQNPMDCFEDLKDILKDNHNRSKKIMRGYTLFLSSVQKGRRKINER
ncbi:hypothetical protein MK805_17395 [Shimazuella sp. AN120528]|uniref:hypothetical protein n=1 Tax=Shimazuella soli TaxID=1892854 RepID=UPI001F103FA8|nr:hypothetical protein [Shimazuella soli]MCH5586708.1 hypothetical protein [Shimazuella soli]